MPPDPPINRTRPAMTGAERLRLHRERGRDGLIVLHVVVNEVGLAEALIAGDVLDPARADDRAALTAATEEQLRRLERFPR